MEAKIWHQSMTDLERLPGYRAMLAGHAELAGHGDFSVHLHGVRPGTYPAGMPPVELTRYPWAHHLIFDQFVEAAVRAEADGYEAMAISCFVDPALDLARSAVDIPVVSSCETALIVGTSVGTSLGLITIDQSMVRILNRLVTRYGFGARVRAVEALHPAVDEFELDDAFSGGGVMIDRFVTHARGLLERTDVDVLIPAEGVLNTVLVRNKVRDVDGVPVLDSYGALLQYGHMLAQLRRRTGLLVGRRGGYAKPPTHVMNSLRNLTAEMLQNAVR
ncbi:aspartate/glutamate racemase family protein [Hyphomicrobium sp.]|uniref:aspartate/glutamate racemase family protein n=1 Tax=Hyphomicrobium sp. TaxID=82 RepID=UPI002FE3A554